MSLVTGGNLTDARRILSYKEVDSVYRRETLKQCIKYQKVIESLVDRLKALDVGGSITHYPGDFNQTTLTTVLCNWRKQNGYVKIMSIKLLPDNKIRIMKLKSFDTIKTIKLFPRN